MIEPTPERGMGEYSEVVPYEDILGSPRSIGFPQQNKRWIISTIPNSQRARVGNLRMRDTGPVTQVTLSGYS